MPDRYQTSVHNSAPNVALAHTVYGDPVDGTARPNSTGDNIAPAVWTVFENYKPPKVGPCAVEGCQSRATVGDTGHCVGHARKFGLIENWGPEGRPNEPG